MIGFKVERGGVYSCRIVSNIDLESNDFQSLINYMTAAQAIYLDSFKHFAHLLSEERGMAAPYGTARVVEDYCNLMGWHFEWVKYDLV